jgi:hypothetical protein
MPDGSMFDQEHIDAAFELAERREQELMALAAHSGLACATVEMCSAYVGMLRQHQEATERGEVMDLAARVRMVHDDYLDEWRAFLGAWQRGNSRAENLHMIDVAVRGYASLFDVEEHTKAAGERLLLDFMGGAVRRLPAPAPEPLPPEPEPRPAQRRAGARALAAWMLSDPRMGGLERRLEALLAACATEGGDRHGPATTSALEAVAEAIGSALARGVELDCMQTALDRWADGTDGPRITVKRS